MNKQLRTGIIILIISAIGIIGTTLSASRETTQTYHPAAESSIIITENKAGTQSNQCKIWNNLRTLHISALTNYEVKMQHKRCFELSGYEPIIDEVCIQNGYIKSGGA